MYLGLSPDGDVRDLPGSLTFGTYWTRDLEVKCEVIKLNKRTENVTLTGSLR